MRKTKTKLPIHIADVFADVPFADAHDIFIVDVTEEDIVFPIGYAEDVFNGVSNVS